MNQKVEKLINNIEQVVIGKSEAVKLAVTSLLSCGHLLIEDVPGVGKTLLAKAIARSINADFKRIQCTPDLLPSDVTGTSIFNQKELSFEFKNGPVFTNILLVDEINRATPRTQSSLLEAMEEHQVSADGKVYKLEELFFVIATQNPIELQGTFPLPEAQLDRFIMKIKMGYPEQSDEIEIYAKNQLINVIEKISPVLDVSDVLNMQREVSKIFVHDRCLKYIRDIIDATRNHNEVRVGVSPRGGLHLKQASQGIAYILGREFVTPDDIKAVAVPVLAHRLILTPQARLQKKPNELIIENIINSITVPIGVDE